MKGVKERVAEQKYIAISITKNRSGTLGKATSPKHHLCTGPENVQEMFKAEARQLNHERLAPPHRKLHFYYTFL